MTQFLKIFRILSLDVVLGALASGSMVVWWIGVKMPLVWWLALPLSVWVIYTADHLLDAYRLKDQAHTPRHLFHHQYFTSIGLCWIIGLGICLLCIPFFLTREIWMFGLFMGGLVIGHLSLVQIIGDRISWFFHKELGVGCIYACGVWGAPILQTQTFSEINLWLPFCQFLLLALINLFVFSAYETETDELDGHTSFVRAIGPGNTNFLILALSILTVLLGIIHLIMAFEAHLLILQAVYACMLGVLVIVYRYPKWFLPHEKYRSWGDAVFMFPGIVWIF